MTSNQPISDTVAFGADVSAQRKKDAKTKWHCSGVTDFSHRPVPRHPAQRYGTLCMAQRTPPVFSPRRKVREPQKVDSDSEPL